MGLFGNTEKAKARRLSKILGYTRDDDKKTLDQLESEFGAKLSELPENYNKRDIKNIVKDNTDVVSGNVMFNETTTDADGNIQAVQPVDVPIDERPELPPGAFYSDDTDTRDEQIIRATLGLGPGEELPTNANQQQIDFQRFLDEENFRDRMSKVNERLNATNFDARDITPKVDMEIIPINEAGTESTNQFFSQLASEVQLDREANLSPGEILRRNVLSSIGEEPELDEARLKRAKTRALVNAFGNLLQAGVGLQQLQSGGYFQAKPIDNSQALAGLEGVYDDYYKELADYRDRKNETMLKLAQLDASDEQRRIDREAKEKEDALRREENQLDRESRERIAEENRRARIDAEKETLATRFANEKDLLQKKLDAEEKIRNANDLESKRRFINDQQRNLNTQYNNTLKSLQEIYDQINEGTKSDVELKRLEEEGVALQNTLKILEGEIDTFKGYARDLITTGKINLESDTETQNNEITEAENTTIQALEEEVARLKEQINNPQAGSLDEALKSARNEIGTILNDELDFTKSNLGSIDLTNLESVKQLKQKLVEIRKDSYSESVRNKYFNNPKADIDSINKLEARVTSLIEQYEKNNTANEFGG